jgi:hypothetical protein
LGGLTLKAWGEGVQGLRRGLRRGGGLTQMYDRVGNEGGLTLKVWGGGALRAVWLALRDEKWICANG